MSAALTVSSVRCCIVVSFRAYLDIVLLSGQLRTNGGAARCLLRALCSQATLLFQPLDLFPLVVGYYDSYSFAFYAFCSC